ncbi:uncharacterized protein LOC144134674 [Amblyomma americanum]
MDVARTRVRLRARPPSRVCSERSPLSLELAASLEQRLAFPLDPVGKQGAVPGGRDEGRSKNAGGAGVEAPPTCSRTPPKAAQAEEPAAGRNRKAGGVSDIALLEQSQVSEASPQ